MAIQELEMLKDILSTQIIDRNIIFLLNKTPLINLTSLSSSKIIKENSQNKYLNTWTGVQNTKYAKSNS